jgi:hypothetical protein
MVLGLSTLQSWCFGDHLGQCLAHYIMGSAFQAYSAILIIMMKSGGNWLQRRGASQEWFDSWVIMVWGIFNTFTEHHGGPWTHKDLQHTLMGVLWWAGGALGIWLSRGGRRNVFPAIIIGLTGWAMSAHAQSLMISTHIHSLFGYALMGVSIARIIEICFVLQDKPTGSVGETDTIQANQEASNGSWYPIRAFQYLPPYLLVASGVLFMSATDEELRWADAQGLDHATWGLIDFSISMLVFLWINVLVDLYVVYGGRYGAAKRNANQARDVDREIQASRSLYSRLSLGQNGEPPSRATALSSTAAVEHHELNRLATHKMDTRIQPEAGTDESNHVLFDEAEEDQDPFAEKDDEASSSDRSRNGRVRIQL